MDPGQTREDGKRWCNPALPLRNQKRLNVISFALVPANDYSLYTPPCTKAAWRRRQVLGTSKEETLLASNMCSRFGTALLIIQPECIQVFIEDRLIHEFGHDVSCIVCAIDLRKVKVAAA